MKNKIIIGLFGTYASMFTFLTFTTCDSSVFLKIFIKSIFYSTITVGASYLYDRYINKR